MKRLIVFEKAILAVLTLVPDTRDDDIKLYAELIKYCGSTPERLMVAALLDGIRTGKYPPFDSVTRLRRKLQDEHEDLRGNLWYERKGLQRETQFELGYNV